MHLCIAASLAALAALSCATVCDETAARATAVDNATNHLFAPLMVCLLARYMLASRAGPTACPRKHCANSFTGLRRLNCTKGKVGPYVSVGVQQHRRHGPCCGRIDAHDKCCRQCNEPLVCASHGLSPCTIHVGFPSRADSLAPAVASVWAAKTEETGHEQALEAGCVAF